MSHVHHKRVQVEMTPLPILLVPLTMVACIMLTRTRILTVQVTTTITRTSILTILTKIIIIPNQITKKSDDYHVLCRPINTTPALLCFFMPILDSRYRRSFALFSRFHYLQCWEQFGSEKVFPLS
jgi:hypothetical protein